MRNVIALQCLSAFAKNKFSIINIVFISIEVKFKLMIMIDLWEAFNTLFVCRCVMEGSVDTAVLETWNIIWKIVLGASVLVIMLQRI